MQSQRNYRGMVIDDDREMRQSLEHLLSKAGLADQASAGSETFSPN